MVNHIKAWEEKNIRSSFSCNGSYLLECRKRRGWTQEKASAMSGFTPRLIQKAESGGRVRGDTVAILAEAYTTAEDPVYCEDIVCDSLSLTKRFIEAYRTKEADMVEEIRDMLAENVVFKMGEKGDPVPFSGVYHGAEGVAECWKLFFNMFERSDKEFYQPKYLTLGNDVIAAGLEKAIIKGTEGPFFTNQTTIHFQFRRGKLSYINDIYNEQTGLDCIKRALEAGAYSALDGKKDFESLLEATNKRHDTPPPEIDSNKDTNRFE